MCRIDRSYPVESYELKPNTNRRVLSQSQSTSCHRSFDTVTGNLGLRLILQLAAILLFVASSSSSSSSSSSYYSSSSSSSSSSFYSSSSSSYSSTLAILDSRVGCAVNQSSKVVSRIFHWGKLKGRRPKAGWGSWGGAVIQPPPARGSGERCELLQRRSGQSPVCPKVSTNLQHSGCCTWLYLTL